MGVKPALPKKSSHKEEVYYKKIFGVSKKVRKLWLGAIMNKIKMSTTKLILINNIRTPTNYLSNQTVSIIVSGANIHLSKQATTKMAQVIISNYMTARLPDGSTLDLSCIATLQLSGPNKQARKIHIYQKTITAPLISLGFLCDDGCIIKLDKKEMSVKKGQQIIKGSRNKYTEMWEVLLETKQ